MRGSVTKDRTVREVEIKVSDVPDVDATREWNSRSRIFSPDLIKVTVVDDKVYQVEGSGHLRRMSGELSMKAREREVWRTEGFLGSSKHLDKAPSWLRILVADVLEGVTSWEPDAD